MTLINNTERVKLTVSIKWEGQFLSHFQNVWSVPIFGSSYLIEGSVLVLSTETGIFLRSLFSAWHCLIIQLFPFFSRLYKGRLWRQWTLQIRSICYIWSSCHWMCQYNSISQHSQVRSTISSPCKFIRRVTTSQRSHCQYFL